MPCDFVNLPGGGSAIVCSSRRRGRRCCACHLAGSFLCDWRVSHGKTCDAPICPEHAQEVAPGKHLCPQHQEAYREWKANRGAA